MRTRIIATAAIIAMAAAVPVTSVDAGAERFEASVNWHPQQAPANTGVVDGASASIVRNSTGISYGLQARELTPGHAYTLWLVVVDQPDQCATSPCTAPDILTNEATASQVTYAAGHVAGASGHGAFAGHVSEGAVDGWLEDRALTDPAGAEVHLIINDHGPMIPSLVSNMISTYRGGCSDDSPFPGIFPASALADGEPGPNTCRLFQSAIFVP